MKGRKLFRKSRDQHTPGMRVKVAPKGSAKVAPPMGQSPEEVQKHEGLLRKLSRYDKSGSGSLRKSPGPSSLRRSPSTLSAPALRKKTSRCDVGGTSLAVHSEQERRQASRKTSFHARPNHKAECEPVQSPDHVLALDAEDAVEIKEAWETCSADDAMTFEQFLAALVLLSEHRCADMQTPFTRSLFDLFKLNDSELMIESEFTEGIALLCVGSVEEKQLLTFQVFDTDRNGYIDMREMYGRCKLAFAAAVDYAVTHYSSDPICSEQLAMVQKNDVSIVRNYVASIFSKYSHHADHRLRYPEFREWMEQDPEFSLQVTGHSNSEANAETHCIWLSMTHSVCGHHHCDTKGHVHEDDEPNEHFHLEME